MTARIAKLESLLQRVVARKDAPRSVANLASAASSSSAGRTQSGTGAAMPVRVTRDIASPSENKTASPASIAASPPIAAAPPMTAAPVPTPARAPEPEATWGVSARDKTPVPPAMNPAAVHAPIRVQPSDDLPDLDFDGGTEDESRRPSLMPSALSGEAEDSDSGEFEIRVSRPPPAVSRAEPIDLSPSSSDDEMEIDRAPLASALPPPAVRAAAPIATKAPEPSPPIAAKPAIPHGPIAPSPSPSIARAPEPTAARVAPVQPTIAKPTAPIKYDPPALAKTDLAEVSGSVSPTRATSFRALLDRSVSLRVKS